MKKISLFIILAVVFSLNIPSGHAEANVEPFYKYDVIDKEGDLADFDNYGYDKTNPVKYFKGSDENIMIPTEYTQDKREFKSAWIATVHNINIGKPVSEADFKEMYMERLNNFVDFNMNTMIFQVRPMLDAYYTSEINPTSEFLSGKQGVDVDYDPLEWMIDVTHEAGLEYHAWLNPYRVTNSTSNVLIGMPIEEAEELTTEEYLNLLVEKGVLAEDNFAVKHPDLVLRFAGKLILNPGYPETIDHVLDTIEELIVNYDLDAIHFDDYFYPYDTNQDKESFNNEDRDAFEIYGLGTGEYEDTEESLEQWRRDNVTNLVKDIQRLMSAHNKENKTAVQLGISPFGIWEHKVKDDRGSNTPIGSSSSYSDSIFADTRKWVDEELIDYLLPQIYWEFDQPAAPYAELVRWWDSVAEGKNVDLYVGHAHYKIISNWGNSVNWFNPELINKQLYFNQQYKNIKGSSLYSYQHMNKVNTANMTGYTYMKNETLNRSIDTLKNDTFSVLPLTTAKPWLSHGNVKAVEDAFIQDGVLTINDDVNDDARFYVVYKGDKDQSKEDIINDPRNIIEKIFVSDKEVYEVNIDEVSEDNIYYVSVLDRASIETEANVAVQLKSKEEITVAFNKLVSQWKDADANNAEYKAKVKAARDYFEDLHSSMQSFITTDQHTKDNYQKLERAEAKIEFNRLVSKWHDAATNDAEHKAKVKAARDYYEGLNTSFQIFITKDEHTKANYLKLERAEAKVEFSRLVSQWKDADANNAEYKAKVKAARAYYDGLNPAFQSFITTDAYAKVHYQKLERAEAKIEFNRLVSQWKDADPNNDEYKAKVKAARDYYNGLETSFQNFITKDEHTKSNYQKLERAEAKIEFSRLVSQWKDNDNMNDKNLAKVAEARVYYEGLDPSLQSFITTDEYTQVQYQKLERTEAQIEFNRLVDQWSDADDNKAELRDEYEAKVKAARDYFDSLDVSFQDFIKKPQNSKGVYKKLERAEAKIASRIEKENQE